MRRKWKRLLRVTPYVGVWIETGDKVFGYEKHSSHPTWVCGLKLCTSRRMRNGDHVTPYVGVWIETGHDVIAPYIVSHTLRGCVD